jgi:hypothetical protein
VLSHESIEVSYMGMQTNAYDNDAEPQRDVIDSLLRKIATDLRSKQIIR